MLPIILSLLLQQPTDLTQILQRVMDPQAEAPSIRFESQGQLCIYDVTDLVARHNGVVWTSDSAEHTQKVIQTLAETIEAKLPLKLRESLYTIEPSNKFKLIVRAEPEVQEFIVKFLGLQRQETGLFGVSLKIYSIPKSKFTDLGIDSTARLFSDLDSYGTFANQFAPGKGFNEISSPVVTVKARSASTISITNQVAYVADYELQVVQPGNAEILDPVIKVVEDGISWDMTIVPMLDGNFDIDLDFKYSKLKRPMKTLEVEFGVGGLVPVLISLPEVSTANIHSLLSMQPKTGAMLVTSLPDSDEAIVLLFQFDRSDLPGAPVNKRIDQLFAMMAVGEYSHRWFPPLEWSDVPALIARSSGLSLYKDYPSSPLSSIHPPAVVEGIVALWFVEGIRESGHCPSFAPLLIETGKALDASPAAQKALLIKARKAYSRWSQQPAEQLLKAPSPLDAIGLAWF